MAMTRQEKVARRRFDRACMELSFPQGRGTLLAGWQAFADETARLQGWPALPDQDVALYVLDLKLPSLADAGTYHDAWRLLVSLEHPRYPRETGWPTFLSRPVPFNPHVSPKTGVLCSGNLWNATTTLAEFVVKVMHLLNFDETLPQRENGLNPDATRYWRTMMGGRPLAADMAYPEAKRPHATLLQAPPSPFGAVVVTAAQGRP